MKVNSGYTRLREGNKTMDAEYPLELLIVSLNSAVHDWLGLTVPIT